jgi:hypothetical protein
VERPGADVNAARRAGGAPVPAGSTVA